MTTIATEMQDGYWMLTDSATGERVGHRSFMEREHAEAHILTMSNAAQSSAYTTTSNGAFGPGRRYNAQRGATQYRGIDGDYSVQIWDGE
jgi:hypothetical protein